MTTQYWLVKQEPDGYSWADFTRDRGTAWTGVRNYQARNHLQTMRRGDQVLFYHSGDEKAVVGIARVTRTAYPDPTADEPGWVAVDLAPIQVLSSPVTLARIKSDAGLKDIALVRHSRLSVMPLPAAAFARILAMTG
jgi:predicted RNA-binding protein with PUA-like domain